MNNLKQLEEIWQSQKAVSGNDEQRLGVTIELMADKLLAFEKKQKRITLFKVIAISIILSIFSWQLFTFSDLSLIVVVGLGWIVFCTILFIVLYWKQRSQLENMNIAASSTDFIETALCKMKQQIHFFRIYFPFFVLALVAGVNLLYYEMLNGQDLKTRLIFHLSVSITLIIMIPIGLKIRGYKFKKDNQPLIDELESIMHEFRES
ncbi:MAG: hypothetical protein JXR46_07935 [Calditrichaceae bacterium]|nr:hypothetical protein [Calditrichaceae bacterium]MBN2708958.1 hypothetical protein [Calditrichaceae bacterium]RQV97519.1 MAG: hypothetical protein EH224_00425 [Calditrichota bacterium]